MKSDFFLSLRQLKGISDYQFGKDVTDILFDDVEIIRLERSPNTNKIRYIYQGKKLLLTLRPTNSLFTLSLYSAKKIIDHIPSPRLRAIVLNEISEFIKNGRNVFCKHMVDLDDNLRPLDEVIVVNQDDEILGIGRLKIPVSYVRNFTSGVAINIRKGVYKSKI